MVPLILILKSWIYLIFLAICRMNPSILWIRERRVRETSLLWLGDSCRTCRGTETLNASTLKGLVSAVIRKLPNVCFVHVGLYMLEFMGILIWDESQNMISSNPLQKTKPNQNKIATGFAQKYRLAWPEWVCLIGSSDRLQDLKLL